MRLDGPDGLEYPPSAEVSAFRPSISASAVQALPKTRQLHRLCCSVGVVDLAMLF